VGVNNISLVLGPAFSRYEVIAVDNLYLVEHLGFIYVGINGINDYSSLTLTELRILVNICQE
jgi:hypothetical protein